MGPAVASRDDHERRRWLYLNIVARRTYIYNYTNTMTLFRGIPMII